MFGLFAIRKIADQRRSRGNLARLAENHRILSTTDRAYPVFIATHLAFFILTPLEIVMMGRAFWPPLGLSMVALFVAASLLRAWSISLLNRNWSSQVAVPEDLVPVTEGPYRLVRHPNYLAMSLEFLAMGLMCSAYLSTVFVGVLNAVAVHMRIQAEEAALFQVPAYRAAMQLRARIIPGIY
jgi:methyltransferase